MFVATSRKYNVQCTQEDARGKAFFLFAHGTVVLRIPFGAKPLQILDVWLNVIGSNDQQLGVGIDPI